MLERDYAMVKNGNCDYKLTVAYDPDPDGISLDEEIQSLLSEMFNIAESYNRSEEHTSELQSLMRISYAVFCLKKKTHPNTHRTARHGTSDQRTLYQTVP